MKRFEKYLLALILILFFSPDCFADETNNKNIETFRQNIYQEFSELSQEIIKTQKENESAILLDEIGDLKEKVENLNNKDKRIIRVLNTDVESLYEKAQKYSKDLDYFLLEDILGELKEINEKIEIVENLDNKPEEKETKREASLSISPGQVQANVFSVENTWEARYLLALLILVGAGFLIFIGKNRVSKINAFGVHVEFKENEKITKPKEEKEINEAVIDFGSEGNKI